MSVSRSWVFTINNPDGDADDPAKWESEKNSDGTPVVKAAVWQREKGAEGTEHYQGWLQLTKPGRLTKVKKLNGRAHWERMRGSSQQAIAYAQKEDSRVAGPWRFGAVDASGQGKRNDLLAVKERLDQGASELDIAEEFFGAWVRHGRAFKQYALLKGNMKRSEHTHATVYFGEPGSGKTWRVSHETDGKAFWLRQPSSGGTVWWDGYNGERDVVLDEFYGWIKYTELLRLIDRTPHIVETKGSAVPFISKRIFITSNKAPFEILKDPLGNVVKVTSPWYPNVNDVSALYRRLTGDLGQCIQMNKPCWRPPEEAAPEPSPELSDDDVEVLATPPPQLDTHIPSAPRARRCKRQYDDLSDSDFREDALRMMDRAREQGRTGSCVRPFNFDSESAHRYYDTGDEEFGDLFADDEEDYFGFNRISTAFPNEDDDDSGLI